MAGRKTQKSKKVENCFQQRPAKQKEQPKGKSRSSSLLSPNGELRERLNEAAIDVKENLPEPMVPMDPVVVRERMVTRSSKLRLEQERTESTDSRKRRSTQIGPPAKRASLEKARDVSSGEEHSEERDRPSGSLSSSSSSSVLRTRSSRLPVMEEEEDDEVFETSEFSKDESERESSEVVGKKEDESVNEEEISDEEHGYEEYSDESESEARIEPLQNEKFDLMKNRLNDTPCIQPPTLMKSEKCVGIGSPKKVWSLMVTRDDFARATKCMLNQHPKMTISMRCMLIDWMMEVCESEQLHRETFHLAVDYVDRFLESGVVQICGDTFQLVGTAALFIAAKYEEIYPPKCQDFAHLTDGAFNDDQVRQMEIIVVKAIDWTLGPITSVHWLSTYMQLLQNDKPVEDGHFTEGEDEHVTDGNYFVSAIYRDDFIHMSKILDYLLFDLDSLSFTYRTIAAAVLFHHYVPRSDVEDATGFHYDQLLPVIEYVEPVVRVFDKHRMAGDPFPVKDKIHPDDIHNIQTHFQYNAIEQEVGIERELLKRQKKVLKKRREFSLDFGDVREFS